VEATDSTVVVPTDWSLRCDPAANLIVTRGAEK
jgi:hypothetical protein